MAGADGNGDGAGGDGPAPMVWALAVRVVALGPPYAELIVELGPGLYEAFAENVLDSGFVLAAGDPPATTAVVEAGEDVLIRLVLVGGRQAWEPASEVRTSTGWQEAARGRNAVVVLVVPPGTWPPYLMDLDPREGAVALTRSLESARAAGEVLHGLARYARLDP
ncbi:hypothetical protein ACFVFS_33030 [Kitasatospora sp. NPDC057692]|uniref:hypothetical protein n=1 Tax=Kitasatospora sp. NPDC057692 TaxID=3346215 RepID=UPI00369A6141